MPEMRFKIRWPDGRDEDCYSPSLVVKDHMAVGESYPLADFMDRSRTALGIASERVRAKYGFSCSLALGQLSRLEAVAAQYASDPGATVSIIAFED